jgi:hypothetical protein
MAVNMIVVIRKDDPNRIFAYHSSSQTVTVSEAYESETFRAYKIAFVSGVAPGDQVDVSEGTEIELAA